MKTHTIISLLVVSLVGAMALPAYAQGGKGEIIKKGVEEVLTSPSGLVSVPSKITGVKRFTYPKTINTSMGTVTLPQLSAALQRSLATAQANASLPSMSSTGFAVLFKGVPEKTFLRLAAQEKSFYEQEIALGADLLTQVKYTLPSVIELSDEAAQPILKNIVSKIAAVKNNHLRYLLSKALQEKNIPAMVQEISQYYSLEMPYEEAAYNYTLRHPYKRNLQTMRLLHNRFIDESIRARVQKFIEAPSIPFEQTEDFKKALHDLHQAYKQLLTQTASTPAVRDQIAYFENTLKDLRSFIEKNNRLPKWNTRSNAERDLYNCMEYLLLSEKQSNFPPFTKYYEQLKELWTTYAPTHRSKQETLQAFENFVKLTGLPYPRTLEANSNISWDEERLFDDLLYWRTHEEAEVNRAVKEIWEMHSQPTDYFYR